MKGSKKWLALGLAAALGLSLLAGCGQNGDENTQGPGETGAAGGTIRIATKPMTEQYILGEMLAVLIEANTDLSVEITKGIGGGTTNIHPALVNGEFDLYPEYTSTAWASVYKKEEIPADEEALFEELKEYYATLGLAWSELYGFNNTFTLAVRSEVAEQYQLETYSDLAAVAGELTFGANPDFYEKADGYPALQETYGMDFGDTRDIDIGLKYQALAQGEVDVINAFTTDAQLAVADVKVLEDDLHLFQNYYCGTVVRQDTLDANPGLMDVLNKMSGILTDQEMAELNYELEVNGQDERELAVEFLKEKGVIPEDYDAAA